MASNEASIAMSLRISEIQITTSGNFTPTLRVGWLSSDFSVFSHWKRVKRVHDKVGNSYWKVGWKSSLVKWVSKSTNNVIIVLFQKVGETESPVAMREIPASQILNGRPEQKHKFNKLPLQHMKNGVLGVLSGWIRCDEVDSEESSAQQQAFVAGAEPGGASAVSQSTTLTQNSVDMSIDLTMDLPREYYPFISDEDVFKEEVFYDLDRDRDGSITTSDLLTGFKKFCRIEVSEEVVDQIMMKTDLDAENGTIEFNELEHLMKSYEGQKIEKYN